MVSQGSESVVWLFGNGEQWEQPSPSQDLTTLGVLQLRLASQN
jgi:hypothetical protein